MSQSTLIVGGILVAFIIWVTLRGNLGKYIADIIPTGGAGSDTSSAAGAVGAATGAVNLANTIAGSSGSVSGGGIPAGSAVGSNPASGTGGLY